MYIGYVHGSRVFLWEMSMFHFKKTRNFIKTLYISAQEVPLNSETDGKPFKPVYSAKIGRLRAIGHQIR